MNNIEVLAPAGSLEAFIAGVRCGADAIYLGQKNFSARKNSQNFDEQQLCEAIAYAHRYGVKVHQALNVLVFDHELENLKSCIKSACKAGIDAFIVQDLGVLSVLKTLAPDIPVHASTQLAIHSLSGVNQAEKLGFSRVVLARELSKEEIFYIRKNTDLELEVFVHGAHCMCISGQCYMSSVFGAKSGNRGLCAQPCRLPFTANQKGEYALSLKDMSLIEKLTELKEMGINSIKIEGRMKRPEYVASAVTCCKKALNGEVPDLESLEAVFSRSGFTSGYFDNKIDSNMFGFRKKENVVSANDVLKPLSNLYHKEIQLVPLVMEFSMKENSPVVLKVSDFDQNTVTVAGDIPEKAKNISVTLETAEKSLAKLGGTPYFCKEFTGFIDNNLFLTVSSFNALRRKAIEKLDVLRGKTTTSFNDVKLPDIKSIKAKNATHWAKFKSFSQFPLEFSEKLEKIILPIDEIIANEDKLSSLKEKIIIDPPRFSFKNEEEVINKLKKLKLCGFSSLLCNNLSHIDIGEKLGLSLFGGPFLNLTNSYSLDTVAKLDLKAVTISIEENIDWFLKLKMPLHVGVLGYGYLPLMSVRNCPIKAQVGCKNCGQRGFITDRMGIDFPVRCDGEVSFIYNSLPLSLSERQNEFKNASFFLLDFTIEEKSEVVKILDAFLNGKKLPLKCTRGLYYRKVE